MFARSQRDGSLPILECCLYSSCTIWLNITAILLFAHFHLTLFSYCPVEFHSAWLEAFVIWRFILTLFDLQCIIISKHFRQSINHCYVCYIQSFIGANCRCNCTFSLKLGFQHLLVEKQHFIAWMSAVPIIWHVTATVVWSTVERWNTFPHTHIINILALTRLASQATLSLNRFVITHWSSPWQSKLTRG